MKNLAILMSLLFVSAATTSFGQCDPSVPLYVIDLSANADTSWVLYEADAQNRDGQCCSADPNENCIQFQITLHPNAAGIFFDYDGAGAFGSLNWQIDCGPEFNLKDTICVTDPGPFTLTFCKPGSDNGNYTLISVSKPTFPEDQTVPLNCAQPVSAAGVTESSITWQSISPGAPGDYDYLLTCTDCLDPVYTPEVGGPVEVQYEVCGYPILDYCVGNFLYCDTVKFTTQDSIILDVSPTNPVFCSGGDVTLTASATGGDGNFTYYWYDGSLNLLWVGPTYIADSAGSYTCEVRDGNYIPIYCDGFSEPIIVGETFPPVVDAGEDQVLCADSPEATISATIQYASGGIWSGGAGTYDPSNTSLNMTYTPTQAEIAAGSLTLTLTSTGAGSGCTNDFDEIQLFFVDTIQTSLSDTVLGCFGETAFIDPSITGGLAPLDYSWTDGTITSSNTLGAGTHCLTITDANGCQVTECLTITTSPELDLTVSSTPVSVNGGSDGTATATPSGGTAPYTYLWSNTGTNQTETGLPYGIYTVTVTDDAGCERTESVVVNEPRCDGFTLSTSSTDVLCNSDSTGTATVTPSGGLLPYVSYLWNDYATQGTPTAVNLPAGVYEIEVIDSDGCIALATATINEPDALLNTMTHTDATTEGGTDGDAQANVTGGFGSYYYDWSTTETTSSISNLGTGWYSVEITDDNGCILIDSVFINEPPCDQFQLFVSTVSPLCNGYLTGEADLTITNGIGPYSITWSTGELDVLSITGAPAGIHTVEVTDAQNCYTFLNFGISEPTALSIGLAATPSTCNGSNNGTIDMTIAGGTYPYYEFLWSSGQTTEDVINLMPGSYTVTITDTNGCQANDNTTLTDPDPLNVILDSTFNVTCAGGSDAAIYISVTGGNMTYYYDWSNGATSQDITGIDVGGYILNVTDGSFCELDEPITYIITEPDTVKVSAVINCPAPGATQTIVDVTAIGGTANYAISSDGGATYGAYGDYSLVLNTGQSYDIVAMDVNGCLSLVYPITIDPTLVIDDITFNLCYGVGQTDEVITVAISGGSADYFVSTDGGSNYGAQGVYTATVPINSSYQVMVMDDNGCESTISNIALPDVFTSSISATLNYTGFDVSCNGSTDGEATVVATGGSGSYSYLWNNGETSDVNNGIGAGNYTVQITDGNGCIINDAITLNEPSALSQSFTTSSYASGDNISCNGFTDGSIDFTISGGTGVYTYDWDNDGTGDNDDTQDLSTIGAGTYILNGTDQNGCPFSETVVLSEPTAFTDSYTTSSHPSGDNISCLGFTDGSIDYAVSGGSGSYVYDWDTDGTGDNDDSQDLSGLGAGTYIVVSTDLNGCTVTETIVLTEPATALSENGSTSSYPSGDNISCFGFNDGSITSGYAGGTSPYVYDWTTSNGSGLTLLSADQSGLTAGTYDLTVTDLNGCILSSSYTLSEPTLMTQDVSAFAYPSGDNISCFGFDDGSINYMPAGGAGGNVYSWTTSGGSIPFGMEDVEDPLGLTAGDYTVSVVNMNGCLMDTSITLIQPTELTDSYTTSSNPSGDNISCNGFTDGSIDYTISGGSGSMVYDWDNDGTGDNDDPQDLNSLGAGTYIVTATDLNGCVVTDTIVLTEPTSMTQDGSLVVYPSGDNISCFGFNDGSIDYTVGGGSGGYTFVWSTSDGSGLNVNDEDQSGLIVGTYDVTTTDINGCTLDTTFTLVEPTALTQLSTPFVYPSGDNITCFGYSDGSIDYSISGGSMPYVFDWDNDGQGDNDDTEDLTNIPAGTYIIIATDTNGCFVTDTITLTEPTGPTQTITTSEQPSGYGVSCFNFSDGWIDYEIIGGAEPYTYDWDNDGTGDNDDTQDLSDLPAGTYSVVATDVNGCSLFQTVIIVEPDSLMLSGVIVNASCYNYSNGSIDITLTGGTEPYVFDWSNTEITEDISGLVDGSYTVDILDSMGCTQNGTFVITEPDSLIITLFSQLNFHDHNINLFGGNDGSIDATIQGGTLPYTYLWSTGDTTEDLENLYAGQYDLYVFDSLGCEAWDTIYLTQPLELELPTAFSPNNDMANDTYDIHGIEAYPDNTFTVFNRWGNIVYESTGYNNTWGGVNKQGQPIPDGVYFAILEININGEEIKKETYIHIKTH